MLKFQRYSRGIAASAEHCESGRFTQVLLYADLNVQVQSLLFACMQQTLFSLIADFVSSDKCTAYSQIILLETLKLKRIKLNG